MTSSDKFGSAMGVGWKDALQYRFGGAIEVVTEEKIFRNNGEQAGDIDILIKSNAEAIAVTDLFPPGAALFRPDAGEMKNRHFFAEIKRSIQQKYVVDKINAFVKFYVDLFSSSELRIQRGSSTSQLINDPNTVLLFVFNGSDHNYVERLMRQAINDSLHNTDMLIYGHRVICVWCDSSKLIPWRQFLENDDKIGMLTDEVSVLHHRLAEKDEEINRRLAEKDKKINDLSAQNDAFSVRLAALESVLLAKSASETKS